MRTFLAVLFAATLAHAQGPWIKDGQWVYRIPNPLPMGNGFAKFDPSEADFIATGARLPTQEEIDARAAQQAKAEAEAEAAATLPIQSATGFAVLDNDGHWIELEPTGDGLPVIGVQISNSPLTPEERALMKAERKAAHDALKAAAKDKKLNDKGKITLLMKAVFGVEE